MMMPFAKRSAILSMCILGAWFPQADTFRLKLKAGRFGSERHIDSHSKKEKKLLNPGSKALVAFLGYINLENNEGYKNVESGTKYTVYASMPGIEGSMENIDPAYISVRGSAVWDPTQVSTRRQDVIVRLPGTIVSVEADGVNFKPDGDAEQIEVPYSFVIPADGQTGIDYSVTQVIKDGKPVFNGNQALFYPMKTLGKEAKFKEYVIKEAVTVGSSKVDVEFPFYVSGKGHCGTEMFTTPKLTCTLGQSLEHDLAIADRLAPTSNRGFGLEFELVSREVPAEIETDAIADLEKKVPENVEEYKDEHAQNYEDPSEYVEVVKGVQYVNYCFRKSLASSPRKDRTDKKACNKHHECTLGEFCTTDKVCKPRKLCNKKPIDGVCPVQLKFWNWETDVSVALLTDEEVDDMGADASEKRGVGMELVAPGPPNVLSGFAGIRSAAEILGVLSRQGVQAGPSQGLHLHVNVLSSASPGAKIGLEGIASIWVAWAKYQLALDEMLSPSRPDNGWSGRLFIGAGSPWKNLAPDDCRDDPTVCTAIFFRNMHGYLKANPSQVVDAPQDARDFCNAMFGLPGDEEPCDERYPHQRYSQVNLMPLTRYGTVEFRPHSATTKIERVARWVQFLIAFVEYFGNTPEGKQSTAAFFDGEMSEDFGQLRVAQRTASLSDLFHELGARVDPSSFEYYQQRKWETGDTLCDRQKADLNASTTLLQLRSNFEERKAATKAKGLPRTPVEILVPVPRED